MIKFIFISNILLFSFFAAPCKAIEVVGLYQAHIVVDSQELAQRKVATQKALQAVLLKVGGKRSVLLNPLLQQAISNAELYQTQYHYQRKNNQLNLVVGFNNKKVNRLFKQANLPLWGSLRPQVLLWLIDEIGNEQRFISDDTSLALNNIVEQFSEARALPIIMPSSESVNKNEYQITNFWGYSLEHIERASAAYSADTKVIMRISDSSLIPVDIAKIEAKQYDCGLLCVATEETKTLALDWRIVSQGNIYVRQYQGKDKEALIQQGLSDMTEFIYQSYALLTSTENDLVIEIRNIDSLFSDTEVFNFMSGLSSVNNIILQQAKGTTRRYKLDLIGSETSFFAAMKLNKKFTAQKPHDVKRTPVIDDLIKRRDLEQEISKTDPREEQLTSYQMSDNLNDLPTPSNQQNSAGVFSDQATISANFSDQKVSDSEGFATGKQQTKPMKVIYLGENNIPQVNVNNDEITVNNNSQVVELIKTEGVENNHSADIPVFYWNQQ